MGAGGGGQSSGKYFISLTKFHCRTPMHLAAEKGHTSTVEFLAGRLSLIPRNKETTKYCRQVPSLSV